MSELKFSNRILRRFVETVALELGNDQFMAMLALSKLPAEWSKAETFAKTDPLESAKTYASLQSAMRTYYGRGARGVLLRVGQRLWNHLLEDAALTSKAQAAVVKRLPLSARPKSALELLARFIGNQSSDITVHTLDLDLLLVDQASPATLNQTDDSPICFVTFGLIRECLYWADGQEHDIEERACRAMGAHQCEFKITIGG